MKRGLIIIFILLFCFPLINSLTGEAITGKISESPTNVSVFVESTVPIIILHSPENTTYYETKILINYSIKNQLNESWYNIDDLENISLGNLTENFFYLDIPLGSHIINFYANNSQGIFQKQIYFEIAEKPVTPPSSSSSGSSGSGGGGGAAPVSEPIISTDKKLIEATIMQGMTKKEILTIYNNKDYEINLEIELLDLENFISIEETNFKIPAKGQKQLTINFYSFETSFPGIRIGKMFLKTSQEKKEINLILEIKEREALFDILLEVLPEYKIVSSGQKTSALIKMTNIGFKENPVDVELVLSLMDLEENAVYESSSEMIAVKEYVSITRKIQIPENLPYGTYLVVAKIKYNDLPASSYDTIEIIKNTKKTSIFIFLLVLFLIALLIFLLHFLVKKKKNKK